MNKMPTNKKIINSLPNSFQIEWPNLPNDLLSEIWATAKNIGLESVAIVGGAVRDKLLKGSEKNSLILAKDLDLVVEGSASELAKALKNKFAPNRLSDFRIHAAYNTAEMKIDGFPIDLTTARVERYSAPGENPEINPCVIEKDLIRRDFTINAMAIELSNMNLIDPHSGQDALEKRELKFLHLQSVEDDPTRIIRAARYSSRLLFDLSPEALAQIKSTLKKWPWEWQQGDPEHLAPPALTTRLRIELELLFTQEPWEIGLENLQLWGGLKLLDQSLQEDQTWKRRLKWASKLEIDLLTAFITGSESPSDLASRLQLAKQQQNLINQYLEIKEFLFELNIKKECLSWSPSEWSNELEGKNWKDESVAIAICNACPMWPNLVRWFSRWRLIKSPISAKQLIKNGWEAGPGLGKELKKLREVELDKYKKKSKQIYDEKIDY